MFTLKISTENAAFEDGVRNAELRRILRRLADEILEVPDMGDYGTVRDFNGNKVGDWKLNTA